jgi:hypothetical protein
VSFSQTPLGPRFRGDDNRRHSRDPTSDKRDNIGQNRVNFASNGSCLDEALIAAIAGAIWSLSRGPVR